MAWTDEHTTVAIKAVGEVEFNMGYMTINYNDPITLMWCNYVLAR